MYAKSKINVEKNSIIKNQTLTGIANEDVLW
jgi:hypothetical protein